MAVELALNLPQFHEDDYNPYKMRVLVEEIERLHAALTQDVDDAGVGSGVDSFNGRTGVVTPEQADYDAFFLTQAEADALYLSDAPSDGSTYGRLNGAWSAIPAGVSQLTDLSDVNTSTPTNRNVLVADGVDWESRALVEADISDLQGYLLNVVEDTGPQLGGPLDTNDQHIDMTDASELRFGTDDDVVMSWDNGTGTFVQNFAAGTGSLEIREIGNPIITLDMVNEEFQLNDGYELRIYEPAGVDYVGILNSGAGTIFSTNGGAYFFQDANLLLRDGGTFAIYDAGNGDNANFSHDGTDFNTNFTATQDWNINLNTGGAVVIDNSGTLFTEAALQLLGDAPTTKFIDDGAALDEKRYTWGTASGFFRLRAFSDDELTNQDIISIDRGGVGADAISMFAADTFNFQHVGTPVDDAVWFFTSDTVAAAGDHIAMVLTTGTGSTRAVQLQAERVNTSNRYDLHIATSPNSASPVVRATFDNKGVKIPGGQSLFITERASAGGDLDGDGQFWVKDEAPNNPMFTDDAGSDKWLGYNQLFTSHTNTSITLDREDCGAIFRKTSGTARTITLPGSGDTDFPVDGVMTIINAWTTANITINASTNSATLYWFDGSTRQGGASTNRTVGPGGIITLLRVSTTNWYMWGQGIT